MNDILDDPALNPPGRSDFRRVGKGVPMVLNPETGKMIRRRRSSSVGKILDDDSNLTDWKLRTVLVGAAQLPEVLAMVSVLDPDVDKKAIRDHVEECLQAGKGNRRRVQGTAVHAMFDHVDLGDDWEPAPQFRAAVDAYKLMLECYGLVPVDVEVHCVNDFYGLAGTMDRRYRTTRNLTAPDGTIIPIGSILVGDTKTGLSLEYAAGTYATQIAAYVDSERYDVLTDERSAFDPPSYPDWALVVHALPEDGTCELYWVDIQQGRVGLELAQQVYEWRRQAAGLLSPALAPLRLAPAPPTEPQEPSGEQESTEPPQEPVEPSDGTLLPEVKEWLRGRVLAIKEHSDLAMKQLARQWPEGVPGLKVEGHTIDQLDALSAVLDQVETDHSVPFSEPDPRVKASRENHPSNRWAEPVQGEPVPEPEIEALKEQMMSHPRNQLLIEWFQTASGMTYPLAHALYEFARLDADWSDDDVTTMLVGTLNAMGYPGGLADLGRVKPEEAPVLMSAAFAITSGTAMLMFDADDRPVVRFNVKETKGYRQ